MRADLMRSITTAAVVACAAVAVELSVTLPAVVTEGPRAVAAYLGIGAAVAVFAALVAALAAVTVGFACRIGLAAIADAESARSWPGLFAPPANQPANEIGAGWLHGVALGGAVFLIAMALTVTGLVERFREPTLIGLLAATLGLVWLGLSAVFGLAVAALLRGRRLLDPARASFDPLFSPSAAAVVWIGVILAGAVIACQRWEALQMVFPWRWLLSLTLLGLLFLNGVQIAGKVCRASGRPRTAVQVGLGLLLAVAVAAALWVDSPVARRAMLRSPTLGGIFDAIRTATDVDRDGYGSFFGEGDCAPLRGDIHPGAVDVPGDGVDQNCAGGDFVPGPRPSPFPDTPLPAALARDDWSILLITIDTLRFDRVGFAGYRRPTTPNLDRLAERGLWFRSFFSTGCWTKDALPALLTSQFAEELPVGEKIPVGGRFAPRRLDSAAVTLPEVLQQAGYRTAMFSALEFFEGWNLEQGVDHHVNLAEGHPYETAPELTGRALKWLDAQPDGKQWFLWVHYYEPHWPYVDHGDQPAFGKSHPDRYDGEIRFVDGQLARFANWLEARPAVANRTIILVTADHGESMAERGGIGHGAGVWDYLIHVPLVLVVPGVQPRQVVTPTSMIDLAPTLTALVGVDPDPSWTGRAHVEEIALGEDHPQRVVFAANDDGPTYAAMTDGWKLIFDQRRNLYQLIDRAQDPGEQRDASAQHPKTKQFLRDALRAWRERIQAQEFTR